MNPSERVKNEIRTTDGSVRSRGTGHKTALIISFLRTRGGIHARNVVWRHGECSKFNWP